MDLERRLQNVAVLGAGGKMGRGIALLLAREMTIQKLKNNQPHQLVLIDVSTAALDGLKQYLHKQAGKIALKNAESLKEIYGPVPDNEALAEQFATDLIGITRFSTRLDDTRDALMIFEAILEIIDLKISVFSQVKAACPAEAFFFSNTSSIPIKMLNDKAGLDGRLIGFHFYNPPPVQKLVEVIVPENAHPDLPPVAQELGKRLGKILIPSNDVAGFIGNGHFIRDGLHGLRQVEELEKDYSYVQAVYLVNRVSQDFLIRPMGIFQLIDYVGLDVFQSILNIMNPHFPDEKLHSELIDRMVVAGIKGGQFPDGSQKDGFLKYDAGKIVGIYDLTAGKYIGFEEGSWKTEADRALGPVPEGHAPWKAMLKEPQKEEKLKQYFQNLKNMNTLGARLALQYLKRSREIGLQLVKSGVANSADDVNGVLMYGFYHLYGPINDFV